MKIISFPFAGGNKYSFSNFFNVPDVTTLEYPGRGLRINDGLIYDINKLVNDMISMVKEEISSCDEYIIYGHSMGALVGYLICKKIDELNLKKPVKLIVSGKNSPRQPRENILSNLSNNDFWKEVYKLGGIPEEIYKHTELIEYFTPILKADFMCIEKYQYDYNSSKLTVPIDVFYGSHEEISESEAKQWQLETSGEVNIKELNGNHFFIFDNHNFFKEYFKNL